MCVFKKTLQSPEIHILVWCLGIPFCMWNYQKVSQCWEISQWNLSADGAGEGLKPVRLCVICNDLGTNRMKLKSQISLTLHRHVDTDAHRICWQCNCISVARMRAIFMHSQPESLYLTYSRTGFSPSPTSSVDKFHWLISQHWFALWSFHM